MFKVLSATAKSESLPLPAEKIAKFPDLELFILSAGSRGNPGADVAAKLAAEAIHTEWLSQGAQLAVQHRKEPSFELAQKIKKTMRAVFSKASEALHAHPLGMSASCECLVLAGSKAFLGHVGNTRTYLKRKGAPHLLTRDHTVVSEVLAAPEQTLSDFKQSPFRKHLTRALGFQAEVEADFLEIDLLPGDTFWLVSDGFFEAFHPFEKTDLLNVEEVEPLERFVQDAIQAHHASEASVLKIEVPQPSKTGEEVGLAQKKIETLRKLPLFKYCSYQELIMLLGVSHEVEAKRGDRILKEGDTSPYLFIVITGSSQVRKEGKTIATKSAGEVLGELGLVEQRASSADVVVSEPSVLLALQQKDLFKLFRKHPNLAVKILWALSQGISQRLRETTDALVGMEQNLPQMNDQPFKGEA